VLPPARSLLSSANSGSQQEQHFVGPCSVFCGSDSGRYAWPRRHRVTSAVDFGGEENVCCRIEAEAGSRGHGRYRRLVISKRHGHRRRPAVLVPALRLDMAHRLRGHLVRKHAPTRCVVVSIFPALFILLRHSSSAVNVAVTVRVTLG